MILVQCHSTTMRTVEVLEKNLLSLTWNCHVLTSFLVLHTKLSKPWDVTHQISHDDNTAKPALLWTRTPITLMKSPGLHNTLLAFPCGCFLWTFAVFALVFFKQLTLLQAMEKYRGSEMAFWKLSLGNNQERLLPLAFFFLNILILFQRSRTRSKREIKIIGVLTQSRAIALVHLTMLLPISGVQQPFLNI